MYCFSTAGRGILTCCIRKEMFFEDFTELVGFQPIVILDLNGIIFNAVGAFGLSFNINLNLAHHTV